MLKLVHFIRILFLVFFRRIVKQESPIDNNDLVDAAKLIAS